MARAGFCSECGDNVYLNDEGACPEGHGPECIHDEYDVDDAIASGEDAETTERSESGAAEDAEASPEPSGPDHPEAHVSPAPVGEVPPRNRTGMLVFAAAAVLLLIALIAGAFAILPALKKTNAPKDPATGVAASKARVETSISFLNALFADDTNRIRPLLTSEARNAITDEQWDQIASSFPTATVEFTKPKWSSDSTAVVLVNTEGSEATLTVGASANSTDTVNIVLDVEGGSEVAMLRLVLEGSGWHVLSITDASGGATLYDDGFVESLYEEATAE